MLLYANRQWKWHWRCNMESVQEVSVPRGVSHSTHGVLAPSGNPRGRIPLQTKSDVFRLLVLHKFGGVWVDTDTIFLRGIRPVVEWGGEFGGKFAMTLKYNNAFLSLRQNSTLSKALLEFVCQYPKDHRTTETYCKAVGNPCHTDWWYNHGPQQWASVQGKGLVTFPLALFDPANDCYGRGLLSGSGAYRLRRWTLDELLELYRGAFTLHTRSYQVKASDRPLRNDTQFGALFARLRELRASGASAVAVGGAVGVRTLSEHARWATLMVRGPRAPRVPPSHYL
eukprot:m.229581 g.229581  ORF g.229581 m.229581 type:complete len:283 (-) comp19250_c1_seq80:4223-5071(-)